MKDSWPSEGTPEERAAVDCRHRLLEWPTEPSLGRVTGIMSTLGRKAHLPVCTQPHATGRFHSCETQLCTSALQARRPGYRLASDALPDPPELHPQSVNSGPQHQPAWAMAQSQRAQASQHSQAAALRALPLQLGRTPRRAAAGLAGPHAGEPRGGEKAGGGGTALGGHARQ